MNKHEFVFGDMKEKPRAPLYESLAVRVLTALLPNETRFTGAVYGPPIARSALGATAGWTGVSYAAAVTGIQGYPGRQSLAPLSEQYFYAGQGQGVTGVQGTPGDSVPNIQAITSRTETVLSPTQLRRLVEDPSGQPSGDPDYDNPTMNFWRKSYVQACHNCPLNACRGCGQINDSNPLNPTIAQQNAIIQDFQERSRLQEVVTAFNQRRDDQERQDLHFSPRVPENHLPAWTRIFRSFIPRSTYEPEPISSDGPQSRYLNALNSLNDSTTLTQGDANGQTPL